MKRPGSLPTSERFCCDGNCAQGRDCPAIDRSIYRFPRTLSDAFPDERAPCIERPAPSVGWDRACWVAGVLLFVALLVAVALTPQR